MRNYTELSKLKTFEERFDYLKLNGDVGFDTLGSYRYLVEAFYASKEWKTVRRDIIIRDMSCDLGVKGYELKKGIYIHHMIPISRDDILYRRPIIFDPEYLIMTSFNTHQAIHYGDKNLLVSPMATRIPNDTCPWKK